MERDHYRMLQIKTFKLFRSRYYTMAWPFGLYINLGISRTGTCTQQATSVPGPLWFGTDPYQVLDHPLVFGVFQDNKKFNIFLSFFRISCRHTSH
jgi:hypothetical protein